MSETIWYCILLAFAIVHFGILVFFVIICYQTHNKKNKKAEEADGKKMSWGDIICPMYVPAIIIMMQIARYILLMFKNEDDSAIIYMVSDLSFSPLLMVLIMSWIYFFESDFRYGNCVAAMGIPLIIAFIEVYVLYIGGTICYIAGKDTVPMYTAINSLIFFLALLSLRIIVCIVSIRKANERRNIILKFVIANLMFSLLFYGVCTLVMKYMPEYGDKESIFYAVFFVVNELTNSTLKMILYALFTKEEGDYQIAGGKHATMFKALLT